MSQNNDNVTEFRLSPPVTTSAIRVVINKPSFAKVVEVRVYEPTANGAYPKLVLPIGFSPRARVADLPKVFVNQIGYDSDGAKRFTAPGLEGGTSFAVCAAAGSAPLFRGRIYGQIGDFSAFHPADTGTRYAIETSAGKSDSFAVGPSVFENACLAPALHFMIDDRSVVGTHASAFGGCPWRDGTYYSFEVPSLVMLYLADTPYYDRLPREIDWQADRQRCMSPNFHIVHEPSDAGVMDAVNKYYSIVDPPSDDAPDIVKLIHWGIGWYLVKPTSRDPSGDPTGDAIHAQTVEQFAFFLYGYPHYDRYFTPKFFASARDFAFGHWESVGLFDVDPTIGSWKGREPIGHSILPNLLMYEVARRLGREDAPRYLDAAVREAQWIVGNVAPSDPRIAKGQRMSEHKTITGLATLAAQYPEAAPKGLKAWLDMWADVMISRSQNMWDFCRYDDHSWAIPPVDPNAGDGALTNDCGSVISFPACALSVADVLASTDKIRANRLRQIATAQFDSLFGRNPLGASSAWRGPRDYPGVVRGWPLAFPAGNCARLELVRGTLNASPTHDQYPNNPAGAFCHAEGWTAYNAAFNVSLAYATAANGGLYGKASEDRPR
jgi:hypothetical protein